MLVVLAVTRFAMAVMHCRGAEGQKNPTPKPGATSSGSKWLHCLQRHRKHLLMRQWGVYMKLLKQQPHQQGWTHTNPLNISPPCRHVTPHPQCPSSPLAPGCIYPSCGHLWPQCSSRLGKLIASPKPLAGRAAHPPSRPPRPDSCSALVLELPQVTEKLGRKKSAW